MIHRSPSPLHLLALTLLFGCSGSEDATPVRSTPAPVVAEFEPSAPDEGPRIVVTMVTQLFERGRVGPPRVLGDLEPGMARSQAIAQLERTPSEGTPLKSRAAEGLEFDSVLHHVDPPIRLFVVTGDDRLVGVQVSLPFEEATLALADLWGPPKPGKTTAEGKVTHVWTGAEWTARLLPVPDPPNAPESLQGRGMLDVKPVR